MEFIYADGGRSQYFKATNVGDCAKKQYLLWKVGTMN